MSHFMNHSPLFSVLHHYMDACWEYQPDTNQVLVYHDSLTPEFSGVPKDFDLLSDHYLENYVPDTDRETWEHFMTGEGLRQFAQSDSNSQCFYLRLSNEQIQEELHEVHLDKTDTGNVLITSKNVNSIRHYESFHRTVENSLDYIAHIDVRNHDYTLRVTGSPEKTALPPETGLNYQEELYRYNYQYVVPEERDTLTENMELRNIIRHLEQEPEYVLFATISEHGKRSYKKLCYRYLDESRNIILLSRHAICDLSEEHALREQTEKRVIHYQQQINEFLENMPVAYCTTKVLLRENGEPYDFVFTYSNKEHSRLEKAKYGELIGKSFYTFFPNADPKWLKYYYDTAYHGTRHVLNDYSPEINKHLLIYTYQPHPGYCGCVVQDISRQKQLETELEKRNERIRLLLQSATDTIVQYDIDHRILYSTEDNVHLYQLPPEVPDIPDSLVRLGLLNEDSLPAFQDAVTRLEKGEDKVSFDIFARLNTEKPFNWYTMTFFTYMESLTGKHKALGYLKNIHRIKQQQHVLMAEAMSDPLTGIYNVKTGQTLIQEQLDKKKPGTYGVMFLFDLDDFKTINDTSGHQMGDQVLLRFARILQQIFRSGDIVYRLGGDEFAAFISNLETPQPALDRILRALDQELLFARNEGFPLKSSIGIFVSRQLQTYSDYYSQADQALYQTKRNGKNSHTILWDQEGAAPS